MKKKLMNRFIGTVFGMVCVSSTAFAGYQHDHDPFHNDFTSLGTAWNPGADTVRGVGSPAPVAAPAPGGATWSRMAAGISDGSGLDPHGGNSTSDFTALLGQTGAQADAYINAVLNIWDAASGFSNLGQVVDSGAAFGAGNGAGGHLGDIRVGAIFIDGAVGSNTLAHAYSPCTNGACGAGGSIGGDTHIDNSNTWVDSPTAGFFDLDLFTVLLHEFGHALGLGHTDVAGSVMEPIYAGARRSLSADDIAGIQALYGAPVVVPLPGGLVLFLSGLSAFGLFGRGKKQLKS